MLTDLNDITLDMPLTFMINKEVDSLSSHELMRPNDFSVEEKGSKMAQNQNFYRDLESNVNHIDMDKLKKLTLIFSVHQVFLLISSQISCFMI